MDIKTNRAEFLKNPLWLKFKIEPTDPKASSTASSSKKLYALTVEYLLENDLNYSMTAQFHDLAPTQDDPNAVEITNRILMGKLSTGKTTLCQGFSMTPDTLLKIGSIHFSNPINKEILIVIGNKEFEAPKSFWNHLKSVLTDRSYPLSKRQEKPDHSKRSLGKRIKSVLTDTYIP